MALQGLQPSEALATLLTHEPLVLDVYIPAVLQHVTQLSKCFAAILAPVRSLTRVNTQVCCQGAPTVEELGTRRARV